MNLEPSALKVSKVTFRRRDTCTVGYKLSHVVLTVPLLPVNLAFIFVI